MAKVERIGRGGHLRVDGQRETGDEEGGFVHGVDCSEAVV